MLAHIKSHFYFVLLYLHKFWIMNTCNFCGIVLFCRTTVCLHERYYPGLLPTKGHTVICLFLWCIHPVYGQHGKAILFLKSASLISLDEMQRSSMYKHIEWMIAVLGRQNTVTTLRPRQNGRHFPDIFKWIFLNENAWMSIEISLKFVPKGPINKLPALVQIMAWRRSGDKPLSEPMMVS